MRVISGKARGIGLETNEGLDTRPTTDRVKENIFNIINWNIHGERVLDLFSGSGALGIEALSRGAIECTFIEMAQSAVNIINRNLSKTNLVEAARVIKGSVESSLDLIDGTFGIVFMDPPYNKGLILPVVEKINKKGLLDEEGIIVIEHDSSDILDDELFDFERYKMKKYGRTCVSFFRRKDI